MNAIEEATMQAQYARISRLECESRDIYAGINRLAMTIGGAECDPSPEQAAADLKYIRSFTEQHFAQRDEFARIREVLNDRIECHNQCYEHKNSGICFSRCVLMRKCLDRDARIAMGEIK